MNRYAIAAALIPVLSGNCAFAQLVEYRAEYKAEYKGRNVGTSVFSLERQNDSGDYVFSTRMQAKGLLRLASPRPVVDQSEFMLDGDSIMPLEFIHEDGSRKGEDNHKITFDWNNLTASVSGDGYNRDIELSAGVLDRGSLQVALMRTVANGGHPASFSVLDEDSVDEYLYEHQGTHTIDTEMGAIDVVRYRQQRTGSSRHTIIDLAPSLDYVPARIEQIRNGEAQSAFTIESIERL